MATPRFSLWKKANGRFRGEDALRSSLNPPGRWIQARPMAFSDGRFAGWRSTEDPLPKG